MVFNEVLSDLESEGYEAVPVIIPACAKNAPHRRDRIWFIAYSASNRRKRAGKESKTKEGLQQRSGTTRIMEGGSKGLCNTGPAPDTDSIGYRGGSQRSKTNPQEKREVCKKERHDRDGVRGKTKGCGRPTPDTDQHGLQRSIKQNSGEGTESNDKQPSGCGRSLQDWQDFPTQSPVLSGDDGFSSKLDGITFPKWRNESIKGAGNAVVPAVVLEIFKAIDRTENERANK